MTRQEFLDEITDWGDLLNWCSDHRCYICENIYDDEQRDYYIDDQLVDMARINSWQDLRDELNNLDTNNYYWSNEDGDWRGVDDEFDDYRDDVLNWAEENGEIDDEMGEEALIEEDDNDNDEFGVDTAETLDSFLEAGVAALKEIALEEKENDGKFEEYLNAAIAFM